MQYSNLARPVPLAEHPASLCSFGTVRVDIALAALEQEKSLTVLKDFLLDAFSPQVEPHVEGGGQPRELVFDLGLLDIAERVYQYLPGSEGTREYVYPVRFATQSILLGPLYQAWQRGPCPRCLERRWRTNRLEEEQDAWYDVVDVRRTGSYPTFSLVLLENIRAILEFTLTDGAAHIDQGTDTAAQGWFYVLHPGSLKLERQLLLADSLCPVCASQEPDQTLTALPELTSRTKTDVLNYRLTNLLDYLLPEQGYLNPESGLLGRRGIPDLKHTVTAPVTGSYYPFTGLRPHQVGWGGHTTKFRHSQRVGLLEGLERYCGLVSRQKPVFDTYEHLAPDALDPRTCGYYEPDVYERLPYLTPPSPQTRMRWTWGYSLRTKRPLLVPEHLVYYGQKAPEDTHFVKESSNGCAIGSCLEEAILYGLLELIERDTFLIHWYAKLTPPRIDPWSSRDPKTLGLLDRLERMGYDIYLLDTRLDISVPTVVAVAVRRADDLGKLVLAAGASLDPEDAIRTALCELAAFVPSIPNLVRYQLTHVQELAQDFTKVALLDDHMILYGLPEMAQHAAFLLQSPNVATLDETYAGWQRERPHSLDLLADLQYIVNWIADLGMDVIVVNQTAPELRGTGLQVVKVLVPGLVPIGFGWKMNRVVGLPRMRTVPRTSGYREADFALEDLNLTPHPFP